MADTPRTQAELLAAFADNTSGDISAQNMRDYVVSQAFARAPGCNATWQTFDTTQTINTGFFPVTPVQPGTPDVLYDPSGLFPASSHAGANSLTWPQYSWAELPEGVWVMYANVNWDSPATYYRRAAWMVIDDPVTDYDDFIAAAGFETPLGPGIAITSGNQTTEATTLIIVPPGATYRVGLGCLQGSGVGKLIGFVQGNIQRIA